MLIAKYTAKKSRVVPTFDKDYQYTVNETVSNGIYTVEIYSDSDFTSCSFDGKIYLLTVEYLKVTDNVTTLANNDTGMFDGCRSLTMVNTSNWDTSNITDMRYVFYGCSKLTQLDLSNFDTSKVTEINSMFSGCSSLVSIGDISNWITNKVTTMAFMFLDCSKLTQLDLSNFDTSKVVNMSSMFYGCSSLTQLDLSNFNTSSVTDISYMFYNCSALVNIGMIYCSLGTINKLSSSLPTTKAKQVYVHDVNSSECTEVSNITFIDYISDSNVITLPVTLVSGDEILWDDSSQRYIIKRSDGTTIQTDITSKFKIDLYTPYTMIYTDNVTSISVNI